MVAPVGQKAVKTKLRCNTHIVTSNGNRGFKGGTGEKVVVLLTAGDHPADLRARNLQQDAEWCDPGIGVQHRVQRPDQET